MKEAVRWDRRAALTASERTLRTNMTAEKKKGGMNGKWEEERRGEATRGERERERGEKERTEEKKKRRKKCL